MKKFMKGLLALAGALSFLAVGCSGGTTYVGTSSSASGSTADVSDAITADTLKIASGSKIVTATSKDTSVAKVTDEVPESADVAADIVSADASAGTYIKSFKITAVGAGSTYIDVKIIDTATSTESHKYIPVKVSSDKKLASKTADAIKSEVTEKNPETSDNGGSDDPTTPPEETPVTVNAAWDFTGNARDGEAVDGVSATKGGAQPKSAIELTTNKTGSGATMTVLTNTKCEWNKKLQFSTGKSDKDLFTITTDAACKAVIKVGAASSSKTSGNVNALKLGDTTIFDFDTVDTSADAVEKTVSLAKGTNTFSGSGIIIATVKLSN